MQYISTVNLNRIAVIEIDNPPVNVLSLTVREQLASSLNAAEADDEVIGVVLSCKGRTFVSGADVSEFGTAKATASPNLPELCAMLERMKKPTVAAIHGSALGGGFELALACSGRILLATAVLSFPEVKLGLIPGAGGTVRLTSLVGPISALKLLASGSSISAEEALAQGIATAVVSSGLGHEAVLLARRLAESVPVRERRATIHDPAEMAEFEILADDIARKSKTPEATNACVTAVRNAVQLSPQEALRSERSLFLQLMGSPQSRALRYLFFAERSASKIAKREQTTHGHSVATVGIVGAGTMGTGIAMAFANAGYRVTIVDTDDASLDRGRTKVQRDYRASVSRGSISGTQYEKCFSLIDFTTSYDALASADLIVEAAFEDLEVKRGIFARLSAIARQEAILASNTSYINIDRIAEASSSPGDVVGMHFFSPAHVMKLVEIVRGTSTSLDVIATLVEVTKRLNKVPVVVGNCHGFVGNRMLAARNADVETLLLEGASPRQIDNVLERFGFPMGPFAMWDLAGLDIGWRNRKSQGKIAVVADAICAKGDFGQKTGQGFYQYSAGSRTPVDRVEVAHLIGELAKSGKYTRRTISDQEILERTLFPLVNEGARILSEHIVHRSSDIDVIWANGFGFPRIYGGPMMWADEIGLTHIVDRLEYWREKCGKDLYAPDATLREIAAQGRTFQTLDVGSALP